MVKSYLNQQLTNTLKEMEQIKLAWKGNHKITLDSLSNKQRKLFVESVKKSLGIKS